MVGSTLLDEWRRRGSAEISHSGRRPVGHAGLSTNLWRRHRRCREAGIDGEKRVGLMDPQRSIAGGPSDANVRATALPGERRKPSSADPLPIDQVSLGFAAAGVDRRGSPCEMLRHEQLRRVELGVVEIAGGERRRTAHTGDLYAE